MSRHRIAGNIVLCSTLLASFAAAQEDAAQDAAKKVRVEVGARVAELEDPQLRTAAREQLVALGAAGVPAILLWLQDTDDAVSNELLSVLIEMGPAAGSAVPELFELGRHRKRSKAGFVGATVALLPWRAADAAVDVQSIWHELLRTPPTKRERLDMCGSSDWHRLNARFAFPLAPQLDLLVAVLQQHNPFRIEVAIDHLAHCGADAKAALPALRAILERPEPRILPSDRTVPLHDKAARAVLAIAPADPLAAVARDVLARRRPPPAAAQRVVPPRIRARLDELIADLAIADRRAAATANLVAFGDVAAQPVAALLSGGGDAATLDAAITVLRHLGPQGASAVPQLVEALGKLRGEHTVALFDALIATLPWSHDFLPASGVSFSGAGEVCVLGNSVGNADGLATAVWRATAQLAARQCVDPASGVDELAAQLDDENVEVREFALLALLGKGAAARPLVPRLVTMMRTAQPPRTDPVWPARPNSAKLVDRTATVRRLAAEVIAAAAAPGDPNLPHARAALAEPPPKDAAK